MKSQIPANLNLNALTAIPVFFSHNRDHFEIKETGKDDFRKIFNDVINKKENVAGNSIFQEHSRIDRNIEAKANLNKKGGNHAIREKTKNKDTLRDLKKTNAENIREDRNKNPQPTDIKCNNCEPADNQMKVQKEVVCQEERLNTDHSDKNETVVSDVLSAGISDTQPAVGPETLEPLSATLQEQAAGFLQDENTVLSSEGNGVQANSIAGTILLKGDNQSSEFVELNNADIEAETETADQPETGFYAKDISAEQNKGKNIQDKQVEITDEFEQSNDEILVFSNPEKPVVDLASDQEEANSGAIDEEKSDQQIAQQPVSTSANVKKPDKKELQDTQSEDNSDDTESSYDPALVSEETDESSAGEFEEFGFDFNQEKQTGGEFSKNDKDEFSKLFDFEIDNLSKSKTAEPTSQKSVNKELNFNRFEDFKFEKDILNQIQNQLQSRNIGNIRHSEIHFSLKPEHLGDVSMRLIMENNVLTAKIKVENQDVKQAIESNFAQLERDLNNQGIKVQKVEVTLKNEADTSAGSEDKRSNRGNMAKENYEFIQNFRGEKLGSFKTDDPPVNFSGLKRKTYISNEGRLDYLV